MGRGKERKGSGSKRSNARVSRRRSRSRSGERNVAESRRTAPAGHSTTRNSSENTYNTLGSESARNGSCSRQSNGAEPSCRSRSGHRGGNGNEAQNRSSDAAGSTTEGNSNENAASSADGGVPAGASALVVVGNGGRVPESTDLSEGSSSSGSAGNSDGVPNGENGTCGTSSPEGAVGPSEGQQPESAQERFNRRNEAVTPLRRCCELRVNSPYQIISLARVNTQYGSTIRAEIVDEQSPTSRSFLFLPSRFREISEQDLKELNEQAASSRRLHIVYKGRIGRADMVELI